MRYIAKLNVSATSANGLPNDDAVAKAFSEPAIMGMEFVTVDGSVQQVMAGAVIQMVANRDLPFRLDIDHLVEDNSTLLKISLDNSSPLELVATYIPDTATNFFRNEADDFRPLQEFLQQWPLAAQYLQNIQPAGWVGYQSKLGVIGVGQCEPDELEQLLGFNTSNHPPIDLALELLGKLNHVTIVRDAEGIVKLETQLPVGGNPFHQSKPEIVILLPQGV